MSTETPDQARQRMMGGGQSGAARPHNEKVPPIVATNLRRVEITPGAAFQFGFFAALGWIIVTVPLTWAAMILFQKLMTK